MANPRFISAIMCTLLSVNTLTLVFAGLMAWLGYAIPARLRQLGFAPELVIAMGFGSLLIACIGLCGLNYSSSQMLYFYAFSCFSLVLLLVIGLPEIIYKAPSSVAGRLVAKVIESTTTMPRPDHHHQQQQQHLNASISTKANIGTNVVPAIDIGDSQVLQIFPSYLFRDILYFSLITLLLLLIVISIIFAQHLSKKRLNCQMKANSTNSLSAGARFLALSQVSSHQLQQRKGSIKFNHDNNNNYYHPIRHQYNQQSTSCELINARNGNAGENYQSVSQRHSSMARFNPSFTLQQYQQQLQQLHQQQRNSAATTQDLAAFNNDIVARSKSLASERLISDKSQCNCHRGSRSVSRSSDIHKTASTIHQQLHQINNHNILSSDDHMAGIADNDGSLLASSCKSIAGDADEMMLHHRNNRNCNYSPKYSHYNDHAISNDDDGDGDADDDSEINIINGNRSSNEHKQQDYLHRRLSRHSMQTADRNEIPRHSMAQTSTSSCLSCTHSLINNRSHNYKNNNYSNNSTINNYSHKSLATYHNTPRSSITNSQYAGGRISEAHRVAGRSQQLVSKGSQDYLLNNNKSQAITDDTNNTTTCLVQRTKNQNHESLRCTCISTGADLLPLHPRGEYHYTGTDTVTAGNGNLINRRANLCTSNNSLFSRGGFKTTPSSPIEYLDSFNASQPYKTTYAIASGVGSFGNNGRTRPRPHSANTKLINPQTIDLRRRHTTNLVTGKKKKQSGSSSVMAMTAAAAAALFGGVVDAGHIQGGSFDEIHQMPADLDEFPLDSADCQCADMSCASNGHHHLEVPLLGIDSEHTIGWNGPREPLLDFGALMMSHDGHVATATTVGAAAEVAQNNNLNKQ